MTENSKTDPSKITGRKQRGLVANSIWNTLSFIILGLVSFITVPIIVGKIGEADYGLYIIVVMLGGFVGLLGLGLGEATLRFVAKYYAEDDLTGVNRILGATLGMYVVIGLIGCLAIIIEADLIVSIFKLEPEQNEIASQLISYAGIGFFLTIIGSAVKSIPEAVQRYDVLTKTTVILTTVNGIGMITAVQLGFGITGLVIWTVTNALLNLLVFLIIAVKLIPGIKPLPRFTRKGLREVFGYGFFAFLNNLIGNISYWVDRLILGTFFGTKEVAYLSVPKDLLFRGAGIYGAVGRVLFPRFSAMNEDEEMQGLYLMSTWFLLCLSIVLFLPTTVILPEFLTLWMSEEFSRESAWVGQLIAASISLQGANIPYLGLLRGTNRVHWVTFIYFTTTGVGTLIGIWFVMTFGIVGAGYRMWVMVWTGFVVILYVCRKIFKSVSILDYGLKNLALPIFESFLLTYIFWKIWKSLDFHGWILMILSWILMALILSAVLWVTNRFVAGPDGAAATLAGYFQKRFPGLSKIKLWSAKK